MYCIISSFDLYHVFRRFEQSVRLFAWLCDTDLPIKVVFMNVPIFGCIVFTQFNAEFKM